MPTAGWLPAHGVCVIALIGTAGLGAAATGSAAGRPPGAVDAARLAAVAHEPDQWLVSGRDGGGTYFSPLAQIERSNVRRLGFAWEHRLGTQRGLEATPLVVDGVMYAAGNFGRVYSLDAETGRLRWSYDPQVDGQWGRYACCDAVNRGLAVWRGRVYVGSLDGYLHALDAATGRLVWKVDTLIGRAAHLPYSVPGAPLVAGDVIVIGNAGADFKGVRGYVSAYDLDSGRLRWRFFTVPRDPRLGPQDQPHLEKAVSSWSPGYRWVYGGGGTVWDGMAYDPDLKLVYVGSGNVAPYAHQSGDDLYTASIIAIHVGTGSMAWYYQVVPGDAWDYDSTQKFILSELALEGRTRRVLMQASKDGFFYVLDRATGELLSARPFVYVNWTRGLDPQTGRPQPNPAANYEAEPRLIYPSMAGAHSWQPMSFSPRTGLVYIPVQEAPMVYVETALRPAGLIEGNFTVAGLFPEYYDPGALRALFGRLPPLASLLGPGDRAVPRSIGALKAFDPARGRVVWEAPLASLWGGGVLSTGGGLVLQGDADGGFNAYDARSGERLAHFEIGTGILAAPMTYRLRGTQFIAVMAGYGGAPGLASAFAPGSAPARYDNEGRIVVFRLGGGAVPKPPVRTQPPFIRPPDRVGSPEAIRHGGILFNRFCGRCHVEGVGELPDLRRAVSLPADAFDRIVRGGALASAGMGRFDDVLTRGELEQIRSYLIDEAWSAYEGQVRPAQRQ